MDYVYRERNRSHDQILKPDWFFLIPGVVEHDLTFAPHGGVGGVEEEVTGIGEATGPHSRGRGELGYLLSCLAIPQSRRVISWSTEDETGVTWFRVKVTWLTTNYETGVTWFRVKATWLTTTLLGGEGKGADIMATWLQKELATPFLITLKLLLIYAIPQLEDYQERI